MQITYGAFYLAVDNLALGRVGPRGLTLNGEALVDTAPLFGAATLGVYAQGNRSQAVSFSVQHLFASPQAAAHFAGMIHGELDDQADLILTEGEQSIELPDACLQSITREDWQGSALTLRYSFIGRAWVGAGITPLPAPGGGSGGPCEDIIEVTASRVLAAADDRRYLAVESAIPVALTVPPQAATAWAAGTQIVIHAASGAGEVSLVRGAGVSVERAPGTERRLRAAGSSATLFRRAANDWLLGGDLASAAAPVVRWARLVEVGGGGLTSASLDVASALHAALAAESFFSKIVYLLPLLGTGIAAARVPLIDTLGVGPAANTGFLNADFGEATGLANPAEAAKLFDTGIRPSQLGVARNGGIGWWENNYAAASAGVEPIGSYSPSGAERFVVDLRSSIESFRWGVAANGASRGVAASNGHYYGQRSGLTARDLFRNGALIGTSTVSDAAAEANPRTIYIMAVNAAATAYWRGRCACAYLTNGTLTSSEIAALHTILSAQLITPLGR